MAANRRRWGARGIPPYNPTGMIQDQAALAAVARELEARRMAAAPALAEFRSRVRSRAYWRGLVPQLSVEGAGMRTLQCAGAAPEAVSAAAFALRTRGYFQLDDLLRPEMVATLRQAVETLAEQQWPLGFTYVYDEFWQLARIPAMQALLRAHLGEDCVQWPGIWTHRIQPERGSHGWAPHVDSKAQGTQTEALGVWFPLSDATLDNGCMYVVARDFAPPGIAENLASLETVKREDLRRLLQSARALPARAGAVLGWDQNVLHWGSRCQGTGDPRISTAMEFASARQAALQKRPGIALRGPLPAFEQRLHLIAESLLSYVRFEPHLAPFEPLAREL